MKTETNNLSLPLLSPLPQTAYSGSQFTLVILPSWFIVVNQVNFVKE